MRLRLGAPEGEPEAPQSVGRAPVAEDLSLVIDAAAIAVVSATICTASHRLAVMTVFVPAVIAVRFLAWTRLRLVQRWGGLAAEVRFFLLCTLLGAFNDWNSVVRHRIYEYDVPVYFPCVTTVPVWMLLYWGMVLRTVATLCRWHRLAPPALPRNRVHLGRAVVESATGKVLMLVSLVVATRQLIYRFALDPVRSWLPFAVALLVYAFLVRPGGYEWRLAILALTGGPLIEMLYIHVGHLHHYHLGWLGGIPLWIALWWVLAVWVWSDLSARLQMRMARRYRAESSCDRR
jgi:hypothetical protein